MYKNMIAARGISAEMKALWFFAQRHNFGQFHIFLRYECFLYDGFDENAVFAPAAVIIANIVGNVNYIAEKCISK